jgi:hypothetical protein
MTVSIEIPDHVAADLEHVERQSDFAEAHPLSLAQRVVMCVSYALYSCADPEEATEFDRFVDLGLRLAAIQPSSNE